MKGIALFLVFGSFFNCIMIVFGNNRYFRLYVGPKVEAAIFISIGDRKKLRS